MLFAWFGVIPVANPDFSVFVQRAKDTNPDTIYIWIPGGTQPAAVGKALSERGIDPQKIRVIGQDVLADDSAIKSMGDLSLGIITAAHYDWNHQSALNKAFDAVDASSRPGGSNSRSYSADGASRLSASHCQRAFVLAMRSSARSTRSPMSSGPESVTSSCNGSSPTGRSRSSPSTPRPAGC